MSIQFEVQKYLRTLDPLFAVDAPRVALPLDVLEGSRRLGAHLALGEDEVTPHVNDFAEVFVAHGAGVFTVAEGGTGPQVLFGDDAANEFHRVIVFGMSALHSFLSLVWPLFPMRPGWPRKRQTPASTGSVR